MNLTDKATHRTESVRQYKEAYSYKGDFVLAYAVATPKGDEDRWLSIPMKVVERAKNDMTVTFEPVVHRQPLPNSIREQALLIPVTFRPGGDHFVYINFPKTDGSSSMITLSEPVASTTSPLILLFPFTVVFDIATAPIQLIMGATGLLNSFRGG